MQYLLIHYIRPRRLQNFQDFLCPRSSTSLLTCDQASSLFLRSENREKKEGTPDRRLRLYRILSSGWQWSSYLLSINENIFGLAAKAY